MDKQDTETKLITEHDNNDTHKKHRLFLCHFCVVVSSEAVKKIKRGGKDDDL